MLLIRVNEVGAEPHLGKGCLGLTFKPFSQSLWGFVSSLALMILLYVSSQEVVWPIYALDLVGELRVSCRLFIPLDAVCDLSRFAGALQKAAREFFGGSKMDLSDRICIGQPRWTVAYCWNVLLKRPRIERQLGGFQRQLESKDSWLYQDLRTWPCWKKQHIDNKDDDIAILLFANWISLLINSVWISLR